MTVEDIHRIPETQHMDYHALNAMLNLYDADGSGRAYVVTLGFGGRVNVSVDPLPRLFSTTTLRSAELFRDGTACVFPESAKTYSFALLDAEEAAQWLHSSKRWCSE